jgi:hypothetical protein
VAIRNYSNAAVETSLSTGCDDVTTTIRVQSASGWPSAPCTAIIDPDTMSEEVVLITVINGVDFTVTRGFDGTVPLSHATGAVVKHGAVAVDFREANDAAQDAHTHGTWGDLL